MTSGTGGDYGSGNNRSSDYSSGNQSGGGDYTSGNTRNTSDYSSGGGSTGSGTRGGNDSYSGGGSNYDDNDSNKSMPPHYFINGVDPIGNHADIRINSLYQGQAP